MLCATSNKETRSIVTLLLLLLLSYCSADMILKWAKVCFNPLHVDLHLWPELLLCYFLRCSQYLTSSQASLRTTSLPIQPTHVVLSRFISVVQIWYPAYWHVSQGTIDVTRRQQCITQKTSIFSSVFRAEPHAEETQAVHALPDDGSRERVCEQFLHHASEALGNKLQTTAERTSGQGLVPEPAHETKETERTRQNHDKREQRSSRDQQQLTYAKSCSQFGYSLVASPPLPSAAPDHLTLFTWKKGSR